MDFSPVLNKIMLRVWQFPARLTLHNDSFPFHGYDAGGDHFLSNWHSTTKHLIFFSPERHLIEASSLLRLGSGITRVSSPQAETTASDNNEVENQLIGPSIDGSTSLEPEKPQLRAMQHVLMHDQRIVKAKWMEQGRDANGFKCLFSRTVKQFPKLFRGNYKANIQRASRYWKTRMRITATAGRNNRHKGHNFVRPTPCGMKIHRGKVAKGRGRKRKP